MKLKMWMGNLDGRRQGIVVAASKERARKILGVGRSEFDGYWALQSKIDQTLDPDVLYTRPITDRLSTEKTPWYRGRCPL